MHEPYLATLLRRLQAALSASELEVATRPSRASQIERSLSTRALRVDGRLVDGSVPRGVLTIDPPVDARELVADWALARPVAVSPDVHQHTWQILEAGDELADPYNKRIAAGRITAGRWDVVPHLAGRPDGRLPEEVCGASPAYDLTERQARVRLIEITATDHAARTLEPSDADAGRLLAGMAAAHPAWRGSGAGWNVDPGATFVAVYDGADPVAGAATIDRGDGVAWASQLCLARRPGSVHFGAALLDVLEALAKEAGFRCLRLDSSAFLLGEDVPYARYGYSTGPPYDGDADVEVWAGKTL